MVHSELSWGFLTLHEPIVTWNSVFQGNHNRLEVFAKKRTTRA